MIKSRDNNNPPNFLAQNLLLLIQKKNITPNQLAQALNIPLMTIRRLLSQETEDPRISTLKAIADFFAVPIDFLVYDHTHLKTMLDQHVKSYRVPKLSWQDLTRIHTLSADEIHTFESVFISQRISAKAFALTSKPSMHPRFTKGTIFIIDPETTAHDGDIVLVHFKKNDDYSLKALLVDPPFMQLNSLSIDSTHLAFDDNAHEIIGVVLMTLLYHESSD